MTSLSAYTPSWLTRWRRIKDRLATLSITAGGAGVLTAILLIFFYLLYEVLPLFSSAQVDGEVRHSLQASMQPLYFSMEEQGEVGFAIDASGTAQFVSLLNGETLLEQPLEINGEVSALAPASVDSRLIAVASNSGAVSLLQHEYRLSYPESGRVITPRLEFPFAPFQLAQQAIEIIAVKDSEEALVFALALQDGSEQVVRFDKEVDFLTDEVTFSRSDQQLPVAATSTAALYIGSSLRWLYRLSEDGSYAVFDLQAVDSRGSPLLADSGRLFKDGTLTASSMLLGDISLLAASDRGELNQYFMSRQDGRYSLQRVRAFATDGVVVEGLLPEHRRKGFLALGSGGELQIYHSTAHRQLFSEHMFAGKIAATSLSPRGNKLAVVTADGELAHWHIDNEHPDISWQALWDKVWYESYDAPEYIWQSSASNNDFEPKYSFAPLAFGTLKAAFYTMLIAAPMAICGAIYTAYFMAPSLRRKVKPMIELMEALPTVILGFLAGLWLAPFIEDNLTGVISVLIIMPLGILSFAYAWSRLPLKMRAKLPDGWHAMILLPVVLALGWFSFAANDTVELWLFGGDMRVWITHELGISFDQRNSLVVGIAMGMAVIPTIFSIAEDAIFSVPKHLSYGSLALGATPWQTLVGVVLPTASPGIFSGLMIGLGRAVGETMIVLMATGNTPIMDANIFEGMRTLSANIAVEVPEAEVDSTHYRVLFLAAFVLFLFTFVVNTIAELVRQRLRIKYGSL